MEAIDGSQQFLAILEAISRQRCHRHHIGHGEVGRVGIGGSFK